MIDIKKRVFNFILTVCLLMAMIGGCLCGCAGEATAKASTAEGAEATDDAKETETAEETKDTKVVKDAESEKPDDSQIELLDPVGVATNYDVASIRDIVSADVYSCVCVPSVTEFEYTSDTPFGKYGKLPGEEVKSGDVLIYGSLDDIEDQIEDLEEEMSEKAKDYAYEMSNLSEDLYDIQKDQWELIEKYSDMINNAPEENASWYSMWTKGFMTVDEKYKSLIRNVAKMEEQAKEKEELFTLENNYDQGRVERMRKKQDRSNVTTNKDGVVVASNFYESGQNVTKNSKAMAVGDLSQKIFLTEYINKSVIAKAQDVYALIDGKRYEVTYEVIEKEEYNRLQKQNGIVYSTFYIDDPNNEIPQGKFGDIVLIKQTIQNVLTIPNNALNRDGSDFFVYLYDGNSSKRADVTVGARDGMYAEITSGLKEGDKVLTTEAVAPSSKTRKLEKGSLSSEFTGAGYLFYPSSEWLSNPSKNGKCYLKELCVERYQKVEAGDVLAKIEVVADNVEIQRMERKIQRQQERLVTLLKDKEEENRKSLDIIDRALDRAIKEKQRAIEDLMKEYNELKEYSGIINITAPYTGIILDKTNLKEGALLNYKENIYEIADEGMSFIFVEDSEGRLSYGTEATVSYTNFDRQKKEVTGTVVTVSNQALSSELNTGYAIISLPKEDIEEITMIGSMQSMEGYWSRSMFNVSAKIRSVDDVVLVPKSLVKEVGGDTFVKVNTEDGRGTYVNFIAGGSDVSNYWVVSGLSEGMEICSE